VLLPTTLGGAAAAWPLASGFVRLVIGRQVESLTHLLHFARGRVT
jgi:hypothetical protein